MARFCSCYTDRRHPKTFQDAEGRAFEAMIQAEEYIRSCRWIMLWVVPPITAFLVWYGELAYLLASEISVGGRSWTRLRYISDVALINNDTRLVFLVLNAVVAGVAVTIAVLECLRGPRIPATDKVFEPLFLAFVTWFLAAAGGASLVGIGVFRSDMYHTQHMWFLFGFVIAFMLKLLVSAFVFYRHSGYNWICYETYSGRRCGCMSAVNYRTDHRPGFWMKLFFFAVETAVIVGFLYYGDVFRANPPHPQFSRYFEWGAAAGFGIYLLSHMVDLYLAIKLFVEGRILRGKVGEYIE